MTSDGDRSIPRSASSSANDRREFLLRVAWGTTAMSLPGWFQACGNSSEGVASPEPVRPGDVTSTSATSPSGAKDSSSNHDELPAPKTFAEAYDRARAAGRMLLVAFVAPNVGDQPETEFANRLGILIHHAQGEQGADLPLCDIWCSLRGQIPTELLGDVKIPGSAPAVLFEDDGSPCRVLGPLVVGQLESKRTWGPDVEGGMRADEMEARREMTALAEQLRTLIIPSPEALRRHAERQREIALHSNSSSALGPMSEHDVPTPLHAKLAPAWVRWRAETASPEDRKAWVDLLTAETARRWRQSPPPGMLWVTTLGCGWTVEGRESPGFLCGMAYVPEFSQRFLVFYFEEER